MLSTQKREATPRGETINLRATPKQKELIDRAAGALGRSRSDFMLETACREAEAVLLDRRYFALSADEFKRFKAVLDRPPEANPRLRRLLQTKPPWERSAPPANSAFDCGEPMLDEWLRRRARQNEESGASREFLGDYSERDPPVPSSNTALESCPV